MLQCLLSNVSFGFGCSYLSHYEEMGIGAQWSNYHTSPLLNDKLSLQACMYLLMLDGAIYGILTWYIEAVFPGTVMAFKLPTKQIIRNMLNFFNSDLVLVN